MIRKKSTLQFFEGLVSTLAGGLNGFLALRNPTLVDLQMLVVGLPGSTPWRFVDSLPGPSPGLAWSPKEMSGKDDPVFTLNLCTTLI